MAVTLNTQTTQPKLVAPGQGELQTGSASSTQVVQRDVLEDAHFEKGASESCSLCSCFKRIYDFFCSLFRWLFCPSDKTKEVDKTDLLSQEGEVKGPNEDQTDDFVIRHCGKKGVKGLMDAIELFPQESPKEQNFILSSLVDKKLYSVLKAYIDRLAPRRKQEFEERYGGHFVLHSVSVEKLEEIFKKGEGLKV